MEARAGIFSDLFRYARALVRAAQEKAKPNGERLPEYTDSRLALLEKRVLDAEPVYPDLEQMSLEFWLSKLREHLTADAAGHQDVPRQGIAGNARGTALARRSSPIRPIASNCGTAAWRRCSASNDPMIKFVLATDAASRAIRKDYETRVTGPTDRAAEKIAKARFAIYGTSTYPDATFSLRLSYGKVEGWNENGTPVTPFTYLRRVVGPRDGQYPFALAPRWVNAQRQGRSEDRVRLRPPTTTSSAAIPARP